MNQLISQLNQSEKLVSELRDEEARLKEELVAALSAKPKPAPLPFSISTNGLQDTSEMVVRLVEMEQRLAESEKEAVDKTAECSRLAQQLRETEEKQHNVERQLKEVEMQVKILNDLREKDTKTHVKCKFLTI